MGSYNFSKPADNENGENLLLIKDRRIAVSYMIQALTIFDHYHFRVLQAKADASDKPFQLKKSPIRTSRPPIVLRLARICARAAGSLSSNGQSGNSRRRRAKHLGATYRRP
jgi:hypothetical protein